MESPLVSNCTIRKESSIDLINASLVVDSAVKGMFNSSRNQRPARIAVPFLHLPGGPTRIMYMLGKSVSLPQSIQTFLCKAAAITLIPTHVL